MNNVLKHYDAVVVGAGFAGIYMLHRLKQQGLRVRVFETGGGVGGTWYWNRYPGARCDIPSMEYSYQFSDDLQQAWDWTERYATQPEILKYAEHVVERFALADDIQFNTRLSAAQFDEQTQVWRLRTVPVAPRTAEQNHAERETESEGEALEARYVVMATGCLSKLNQPKIAGLNSFKGGLYHTGNWPHEGVDFTGQQVGIIGTGSSAIQTIPLIAEQASRLTIFQRSPNYSIPAHNAPLEQDYIQDIKNRYREYRQDNWQRGFGADFRAQDISVFAVSDAERQREYEDRWRRGGLAFLGAFNDLVFDDDANATAREFFRSKIRHLVKDPLLADKVTPTTPVGCKRLCVDTNYYETLNQGHVHLVDLNENPIRQATASGLDTDQEKFALDSLILATGFDAMTGAILNIDIRGIGGKTLQEKWAEGPRTYLGIATASFPNLFMVTGPGSPSVLSNMLPSIEQHVEWIASCVAYLEAHQYATIEVAKDAEDAWVAQVNDLAELSIFPRCNSWYLGANVEGKKRVFLPYIGVPPYVEKCRQVVAADYEGFLLSPSR